MLSGHYRQATCSSGPSHRVHGQDQVAAAHFLAREEQVLLMKANAILVPYSRILQDYWMLISFETPLVAVLFPGKLVAAT